MKAKRILFVTQEITPFVPETYLSKLSRSLAQATQEAGSEVRIFTPKWGTINIRRNQLHEVIRLSGMNLIIDETDHPLIIRVASLQSARSIQVYFIENDDYFQNRLMTFDEQGVEYPDNDERAIFFARGVLEAVKKQSWCPDLLHCHGWISALVPLYIKSAYKDEPSFRDAKVIFSLHCDEYNYSKPLPEGFLQKLLHKDMTLDLLDGITEPTTYEELARIAIKYSDGVVVNSDTVPASLVEYAQSQGKPLLPLQSDEEYNSACVGFYKTFLGE
ncbi:MAG: glycogen/starch synthase [Bacteroidaceae bacterium]|nr:glycogen/starch synthase [Bacteroidaceae bacterium]